MQRRKNLLAIRRAQALVYERVSMLKDQLITIANTLAWVSVKKVLGEPVPQCPGGFTVYDM